MAEKPGHAYASPALHGLCQSPGTSYILNKAFLMQNLITMPGDKGQGNPTLTARDNLSQPSSLSMNSSSGSPKENRRQKRSTILASLLHVTFSVASATVLAPIERVSLLMQCQNEMLKSGRLSSPYIGMRDCFVRTIKHEGVASLWRGNSVNVVRHPLLEAAPFALGHAPYASFMLRKMTESHLWKLPFSTVPVMLCYYPLDYAHVRLSNDVKTAGGLKFSLNASRTSLRNQVGNRQFSGILDVYKKTLQSNGIGGIFRGFTFMCVGLFAHSQAVREMRISSSKSKKIQKSKMLTFAMFSLIWYGLPVMFYPVRTVSRRMMMTSGEANKYRGAVDAIYQIVKNEGVSSLYKGVTPYVIHKMAMDTTLFAFLYSVNAYLIKRIKSRTAN